MPDTPAQDGEGMLPGDGDISPAGKVSSPQAAEDVTLLLLPEALRPDPDIGSP